MGPIFLTHSRIINNKNNNLHLLKEIVYETPYLCGYACLRLYEFKSERVALIE
ncbi:hypothetical protein BH10ACI3_BH10ACI3_00400 [soil metagenome]